MKVIAHRNRIESQLISYKRYLKFCPEEALGKLCIEIAKLEHRMETIRNMSIDQLNSQVPWQYSVRQSKANKLSPDTIYEFKLNKI
jgi:hypothetical protein